MIFGGAFEPKDCRKNFEQLKLRIEAYGIHLGEPINAYTSEIYGADILRK